MPPAILGALPARRTLTVACCARLAAKGSAFALSSSFGGGMVGGGSGTPGEPAASPFRALVRRIGAETRGARGGENGESSNATTRPGPLTAFNHLKFQGPMPSESEAPPPPPVM